MKRTIWHPPRMSQPRSGAGGPREARLTSFVIVPVGVKVGRFSMIDWFGTPYSFTSWNLTGFSIMRAR